MSGLSGQRTYRADRPDRLLKGQETAVSGILRKILKIVEADESRDQEDDIHRPHQVFCLDGARGAGKTFSLLSLEYALRAVSSSTASSADGRTGQATAEMAILRQRVAALEQGKALPQEAERKPAQSWDEVVGLDYVAGLRRYNEGRKRPMLIHPLRIIFPGDMEQQEVLMEAIFAAIRRDIDDQLKDIKDDRRRHDGEALRTQLTENVAQGWYFARRFGVEAVVKDSMDFKGLVKKFDDLNRLASNRITAWRDFVDAYLGWRGVACMAVMLDDSDVSPDLTFNILHSIRTFLNHPRIVTVIAGNLRAMRDSLVHLSMQRLGKSVRALNDRGHVTGTDWRRAERVAIEHYLEKVLPDSNRFFLARPRVQEDFERVTRYTLTDICERRAELHREDFHKAKFQMAILTELDRSDMPNERETHQMEDYLSWWLYQTRYLPALAPRSARQAQSFGEFYSVPDEALTEEGRKSKRFAGLSQKRLPVMLFANPANHSLVQRFSDDDPNVSAWLMRQNLKSHWVGVRHFEINGRKVPEGSYTYDYIRYRIDLGLTLPIRYNGEAMPPLALLPMVRGRRRMRRFFHPRTLTRQARKIGVARWMDHAAIPGNCLCFYDIVGLPDRAFVDLHGDDTQATADRRKVIESGGAWEAQLWAHWPELLNENPDAPHIARYFTDIVCERLRLRSGEIRTAPLLALLGAERPAYHTEYNYHEFFKDELKLFCSQESEDQLQTIARYREESKDYKSASKALKNPAKAGDPDKDDVKRSAWIARYSALATDLRRAWHAICIHQNTLRANAVSDDPLAFSSEGQAMMSMMQNAERMRLYRLSDILKIIDQDEWMRSMLEIFVQKNLEKVYGAPGGNAPTMKELFAFERGGKEEPPAFEDAKYFKRWIVGWRRIGRALCERWPIADGDGRIDHGVMENSFFEGKRELKLEVIPPAGSSKESAGASASEEERKKAWLKRQSRNMRSARDFVWLMFGLAPSLPAVIHAEIAGLVFDGLPLPGSGKGQPSESAQERLHSAEKRLEEWSRFVATSSAVLRYVKTKCLQLHAAVAIREADIDPRRGDSDGQQRRPTKMEIELSEEFKKYLQESVDTYLRKTGKKKKFDVKKFFSAFALEAEFSTELRIMPDFAPATLFGPHWILGLAKRWIEPEGMELPEDENAGDSSTEGAFGETEHWLWGTHVMIAQARVAVAEAMAAEKPNGKKGR